MSDAESPCPFPAGQPEKSASPPAGVNRRLIVLTKPNRCCAQQGGQPLAEDPFTRATEAAVHTICGVWRRLATPRPSREVPLTGVFWRDLPATMPAAPLPDPVS